LQFMFQLKIGKLGYLLLVLKLKAANFSDFIVPNLF
jgi:hypothetical protein